MGSISLPRHGIACYKLRMATQLKIGFLGAGKMATALAKGFVRAKIVAPQQIIASARSGGEPPCLCPRNRRENFRAPMSVF